MYHFHLFSLSGFLLTPVLYIPIALALTAGLGVLLFGWVFPPLADVFGVICDINLAILERVVQAARS